jgi:hypothetical protein
MSMKRISLPLVGAHVTPEMCLFQEEIGIDEMRDHLTRVHGLVLLDYSRSATRTGEREKAKRRISLGESSIDKEASAAASKRKTRKGCYGFEFKIAGGNNGVCVCGLEKRLEFREFL